MIQEFKVNEYLTLKLEKGKTNIYIQDKLFQQCRFLLINIPVEDINSYDEFKSIDEVAEYLNHSLEGREENISIPPEVEFWGHCSNLQAWFENGYDVRLLHSNLAFPLLRRLTEVEDSRAKLVFQEEICKRFTSFHPPTISYLTNEGFLRYLTEVQKEMLLRAWIEKEIENAVILLIGKDYLKHFGEQFLPLILENLDTYIKKREETYFRLTQELLLLFPELGIINEEEFIIRLLRGKKNLLQQIFEFRQPLLTNNSTNFLTTRENRTRLDVLEKLNLFLEELEKDGGFIKQKIKERVRDLFETLSIGNVFSLLKYKFYKLLSLSDFKEMMLSKKSPFLENFFNYLGHDDIMRFVDSSAVPSSLVYTYFDEEAQDILSQKMKQLPFGQRVKMINGLTKWVRTGTYTDHILRFSSKILKKIDIEGKFHRFRIVYYEQKDLEDILINPHKIVITDEKIFLRLTFPQSEIITYTHIKRGGFTRADLLGFIFNGYQQIYKNHKQSIGNDKISHHHLEDLFIYGIFYDVEVKEVRFYIGHTLTHFQ